MSRRREEAELDKMRDEEIATRYFMLHWDAATQIQRVFRGFKARWARVETGPRFFMIVFRDHREASKFLF